MRARCVAFTGVGEVDLREFELPSPGRVRSLVQTRVSVVSAGTDGRTLAGLQVGAAAWPLIPGYSLCGTTESGERVYASGTARADLGLTWGGHVERAVVPEAKAIPVDPRLSDVAAAMGTCWGSRTGGFGWRRLCRASGWSWWVWVRSGRCRRGCSGRRGADVLSVDRNSERVAQDAAMGGRARVLAGDLAEIARDADVVVDATGVASALAASARALRIPSWSGVASRPGRLVCKAAIPPRFLWTTTTFSVGRRGSCSRATARREDIVDAFALVAEGRLTVDDLAPEARPEDAPAVYAELREGRRIGAAFRWS